MQFKCENMEILKNNDIGDTIFFRNLAELKLYKYQYMKITPEEIKGVLDYVTETPVNDDAPAKLLILDYFMKYYSELSEEEKEVFPNELVADLRLADYQLTVAYLSNDNNIEALKTFVSDDLDLSQYRDAPPNYRAEYAHLNAVACMLILANTPKQDEAEHDLWIYRGLKAADLAIDLYSRMDKSELFFNALEAKVEILKNKSYKEAAESAIIGIRMAPNDELRLIFADLWKEITNERFDLFYEPKEISYINQLPLPKDTIEWIYKEDSAIGKLADQCLCSIEPNYDRSPILFVEKIEDIATPEIGELSEDAKYVFCLDRIPPELRFDEGHPQANILYEVDEEDTTLYHAIKEDEA